jgi:antitoxin component YwqK of YwqJK toxin-antitoxin module
VDVFLMNPNGGIMLQKKALIVFLLFVFMGYSAGCESKHKTKEEHYPDGKLKALYTYNDAGLLDGISRGYYESGKIESERNYKDGKLEGIYKSYYENGNLKSAGEYKAGTLTGRLDNYDENGMIKRAGNDKTGDMEDSNIVENPLANSLKKQGKNTYKRPTRQERGWGG